MEERENNLAMMRAVLEMASDLGVGLVKVFAAWPGLIDGEESIAMYAPYERGNHYRRLYPPDLRKWQRAVAGIREVAGWAADMGITLALQNHAPVITPGYEDALAMMQEIDRPNVKLCLDAPLFYDRQSDEYVQRGGAALRRAHRLHTLRRLEFQRTAKVKSYRIRRRRLAGRSTTDVFVGSASRSAMTATWCRSTARPC